MTITLRPHQQNALEAMQKYNKGQVIIPTGGGKTICMIEDAKRQIDAAGPTTIVVVAPRILLAEQLCKEFLELIDDAAVYHVHSGETEHFSIKKFKESLTFFKITKTLTKSNVSTNSLTLKRELGEQILIISRNIQRVGDILEPVLIGRDSVLHLKTFTTTTLQNITEDINFICVCFTILTLNFINRFACLIGCSLGETIRLNTSVYSYHSILEILELYCCRFEQ